MHQKVYLLFALILSSATQKILAAGDSTRATHPIAVLVQLSSEQNKVALFKRNNDYTHLNILLNDAKIIRDVTIKDYKDHFKYCPVYYFIDTNLNEIKEKRFEGILLNADGSIATRPVINKSSSDYVIVYYGYPNMEYRSRRTATDELQSSPGRGLIVMNDRYKQIANDVDPDYISHLRRKHNKEYSYVSKHFNMQYIPYAVALLPILRQREEKMKLLDYKEARHPGRYIQKNNDNIPEAKRDGSFFPDKGGMPTGTTPDYNESKRNAIPKEDTAK